jgi:hypothetical protein
MNACRRLPMWIWLWMALAVLPVEAIRSDQPAHGAPPPAAGAATGQAMDFARDIRPLLEARCWDCHGRETREAGLRLDRGPSALAGGDSGAVIRPGDAAHSPLIERVESKDPERVMPPEGDRLSPQEVALLRAWIDTGAQWPAAVDGPLEVPDHWAYRPVVRVEPAEAFGHLSAIDAFVASRLKAEGLAPSPEADRYTLIRRLYLDLIGLPPEVDEVDAFVSDPAPDAYERLVDRLLQSPHFGERWGRHWLDRARYADSDGYEKDRPRYNAWKYRDWVIRAINEDMPFDQFTIEQLAGDLLPGATPEQLLATGFNRQTLTNTEGGTDPEQWRVEAVFDRVETLGTAWLGLTIGCARCHSHKYDAISQREYYELFAFFNNGDEASIDVPSSPTAQERYERAQARFVTELTTREAPLREARERLRPAFPEWLRTQQARLAMIGEQAGDGSAATQDSESRPLEVREVRAEQGTEFAKLPDGSYLAEGQSPVTDTFVVTAVVKEPVTGLQLEVLADDRLPGKGPGRSSRGNFVLSELTVDVATAAESGSASVRLRIAGARADHEQSGFGISLAIDQRADGKGWAISDKFAADHRAVFAFEAPVEASTERPMVLTIRLSQQYRKGASGAHTIGRFRLLATTGLDADLLLPPDAIRKLLAVEEARRTPAQTEELFAYFAGLDPAVQDLQHQLDEFRQSAPFNPAMAVAIIRERTEAPRQTHVFKRGDFLQPLGPVAPATLEVLPGQRPDATDRPVTRLDLARWVVSPENPLTPRVVVNQIWQQLFGRGLVKTVNDFGVRGEPPTHPELLDWLATEFVRLNWSRKQLLRTILLSRTYRQSSAHRSELVDVDPENRWLSRQNRLRVEAEIIRDLSLAVSGLLERRIGGPSVFPPLPPGIAELSYANNFTWGESDWNTRPDRPFGIPPRDDQHRRGMYTFFKRTATHPQLSTFDCPDGNTTCVERKVSNTPLQALTTLNNESFFEAARAMARRVQRDVDTHDLARLEFAFRLCLARPPADAELAALQSLLVQSRDYYAARAGEARTLCGLDSNDMSEPADFAAWTVTTRVLLNLDEFITRE